MVITISGFPEGLVDAVAETSDQFSQSIGDVCQLGEVPEATLRRLLASGNLRVALSAAIGSWCNGRTKTQSEGVRKDCGRVILRSAVEEFQVTERDEYWLGKVLRADAELALGWLVGLVSVRREFVSGSLAAIAQEAISGMSKEQRLKALAEIQIPSPGIGDLIAGLVGDDPEIYCELLQRPGLSKLHLFPLRMRPIGTWVNLAVLALDAGYTPVQVLQATGPGMESWSGLESELWREWVAAFEALLQHSNSRLVKVAQLGAELTRARMQKCLEIERLESVRGRS
jgi:hypothetical protein